MHSKASHISQVFFAHDGAYLIGYPKKQTVEALIENIEDVYEQKTKPSISSFKLFPKQTLKTSRLGGSLMENVNMIAEQFQYEEDYEAQFNSGSNRKKNMSKTTSSATQGSDSLIIKKNPLYRLYSPSNPVLREEYSIYFHESYKKIASRDEQDILKQRVKEWIDIGYHMHVAQAFKVEQIHGKHLIFMEKLKGRTLRDWIDEGFFADKNKYLNSKRILNCILQIAVGLNYIHKANHMHQELIPDHIFVEQERVLKIGHLASFNPIMGKMAKGFSVGGSPQYWSPEQGNIYDKIREYSKEGNYSTSMKLLPSVNLQSDLYQLGLLMAELLFSERLWERGDKVAFSMIVENSSESHANKQTIAFLLEKIEEFLRPKPQSRCKLGSFVVQLLQFYAKNFKNAEDLLWCKFFNEEKYESDLLNNKAVGLYLSGNEIDCERAWMKSISSNPQNLIAQYNYGHFKRMKRVIDDKKLNKDLSLLPESRKRNYFTLISNLVMLPLLKEPFKTFNFNPKLSKHKQIQTLSNILDGLEKFKKPKDYSYIKKYHLRDFEFDEAYILDNHFLARGKQQNTFYAFRCDRDIRSHTYVEIKCPKEPSVGDGRQAYSALDPTNTYLAVSDNSYLCIVKVDLLDKSEVYMEIGDYGSSITTLEFDQKSEVLGVGSNEFTVKLINLANKNIYKVINIGQKFIIRNLQYYDRNTCICYSYEKAVTCNRIETTKQLFTIRANAHILNYRISEVSLSSHVMIVHTSEKFEIWNLKDKVLIRNIDIDEAPSIEGFYAVSSKKLVVHYTKHSIRIWSYSNGLILKSYRTPVALTWVHTDSEARNLRSLDSEGNFVSRQVDFSDFIKFFEGVCLPNEIALTEEREEQNEEIGLYVKLGRELIGHLNEYRLNEQEKKVSLEKMYRLAETIKSSLFYQDKPDLKVIFTYLNSVKQGEDKSSRINAHSEEHLFTSHADDFITATSNLLDGHWLIGHSDGTIRLVSAPDALHLAIKPKLEPIRYLHLQTTSIFIGYQSGCYLLERDTLNIVVTHSAYHKKPVRMGLVLSNVLATGDEDELILFWNKEKVRRYRIPVNLGDTVGKRLIIAGFDNRVRIYEMHPENGIQKQHVFIGHVQSIFAMQVIDDGVFTTSSYDGTIRWWNVQAKNCFSYYNFKKFFRNEKVLCVDMPKFSLEEEKHARFDREGCALVLLNGNEVVIFDTMRKEVKWRYEMRDELVRVFWTHYPNQFAAVTYEEIAIINVYWRYMVIKK